MKYELIAFSNVISTYSKSAKLELRSSALSPSPCGPATRSAESFRKAAADVNCRDQKVQIVELSVR